MIMNPDRTQLVEELRQMMDELCAPELTLARADVLRPRITRLLETIRESNESPGPRANRDRFDCESASRLVGVS